MSEVKHRTNINHYSSNRAETDKKAIKPTVLFDINPRQATSKIRQTIYTQTSRYEDPFAKRFFGQPWFTVT